MLGNNNFYINMKVRYIPFDNSNLELIRSDDKEKIEHLKAQKRVKIYFENDRFIIYTYKVQNVEISVNFNTKHLVEWSKEQLKGVLVE